MGGHSETNFLKVYNNNQVENHQGSKKVWAEAR